MSRIENEIQQAMALQKTSSAPTTLTQEQQALANDLIRCHGNIRIANEQHGLHFHIACPECLKNYGERELYSMHLAINVTKYLNGHVGAALCMKTDKKFRIDELTMWEPLEKRGYPRGPERVADQAIAAVEFLEPDALGRMVPKSPGEVVSLRSLPNDHPAIIYLESRQFKAADLERQFDAKYCVKERDDIRYRRLLGGFKASPQGRIVFYTYQNGERKGWQARIMEMEDEKYTYYYQPYKEAWIRVKYRETPESDWELMEGWDNWNSSKYIAAHGMRRGQCLMGYDAARAFNSAYRSKQRWTVLAEGPLDAARFGPPAVAVCGKSCSQFQTDILEQSFDVIAVVPDNDKAGSKLTTYVSEWIGARRKVVEVRVPPHRKDLGALSPEEVKILRTIVMRQLGLI